MNKSTKIISFFFLSLFIAYFFNFYLIENKTSYKKKIYIIISRYNLTYLLTERTELNNFKDETNPEEEITSFRKQLQEKISKLNFKINKTNYTDAVLSSDPNFYSQNSEYITGFVELNVDGVLVNSWNIPVANVSMENKLIVVFRGTAGGLDSPNW